MNFVLLDQSHEKALEELIAAIETNLPDPTWWLPIKPEARKNFLNPAWTRFIGVEIEDSLIAASGLFLNPFEYGESARLLGLNEPATAEIGRCMVLPSQRGKNLMFEMNMRLVELAKNLDRTHLVATAHPDNTASCQSLQKLGMELRTTTVKSGYPRNVYCMAL